jgi:hypothetical protein
MGGRPHHRVHRDRHGAPRAPPTCSPTGSSTGQRACRKKQISSSTRSTEDRINDPTVPPGRGENKLAHHSDAGRRHTSFRFTPHPLESDIDASVGTVSDALDHTLAEPMIALRETQLIKPRSPWHTIQEVDVTTAKYVDWHNNRLLRRPCGSRPPVEYETLYELGDLISPAA